MSCQLTNIQDTVQKNTNLNDILQLRVKILRSFKRNLIFLKNRIFRILKLKRRAVIPNDIGKIDICPGDIIVVRSRDEIQSMLDDREKYKGCFFIDEMYEHCEKQYKVLKEIKFFFDESKQKGCKCRNTVILDGVVCSGRQRLYSSSCDRMCFFFWHTSWLKKVK